VCGAIAHGRHNAKAIATGCADPSYGDNRLYILLAAIKIHKEFRRLKDTFSEPFLT
jgi:hypothetical protein